MAIVDVRPAWALSGGEMLAQLDVLHAEVARLQTRRLELIARIDETGYAKEVGAADTVQLLAFRHRLDPPAVRRDLKFAKALPKYDLVAAALPDPAAPTSTDGSIQYHDPATNQPDTTGESTTDEHGQATDPGNATDLGKAADLAAAARRERAPHVDAAVGNDGDGTGGAGTSGAGSGGDGAGGDATGGAGAGGGVWPVLLHPAQAEAIVSALEQVPARAMVPVEDLHEAEAQLVEAARHLSPADLRRLGAKIRDLLDTDGPEPAEDAATAREALWLKTAPKGVRFGGYLANENAELLRTLINAGAGPKKTPDGARDPRSRTKRQADALVSILNAAARSGNAAPAHGGIAPHLTLTMDFFDLKKAGADATGDVTFGDGLSAAAVRRLACDAGVIPIVLGSNSEPLDVGREKRFVNTPIRRALIARDKGCVICGAPPDHCDVHHLVHWIDGGETKIDNLALVCKPDHRNIDRGDWIIQITNGKVVVTRPGWAEPNHPQPDQPGHTEPGHPEPGHVERIWGGDPATGTWEGDPADPGDPGRERSGEPGEAARGESPPGKSSAGESPPGESSAGGWAQGGRGSGAGERAWPWTGDPDPLTKEAADRLNAWGDDQPTVTPARTDKAASGGVSPWGDDDASVIPARVEKVEASAGVSPWGDDEASVAPARGDEATAITGTSPWGDSEDASTGL